MDLIETVFFVLRKKPNQVTFLHLYHHCAVIYYTYISLVDVPGGAQMMAAAVNSFVHALMYGYYFVTIYDRDVAARWMNYKRRITQVQMVSVCSAN